MTDTLSSTSLEIHILNELFSSATHNASVAMCLWTKSLIRLTLNEVCEMPLEKAYQALNFGDEEMTMVVLNLEGELGGSMVMAFSQENGRQLAALLTETPMHPGPDWTELEQSALMETGNILGCAYVDALTRLIDQELVPSPPYFVEDFGASVVQQALVSQATSSDTVLVCRTCFGKEGEQLDWWLLFVPSPALREAMENVLANSMPTLYLNSALARPARA